MGGYRDQDKKAANEQVKNALGERLAELREQRGWKQETLAGMTRIKRSTISKFETGEQLPSSRQMAELVKAFDLGMSDVAALNGLLLSSGSQPVSAGGSAGEGGPATLQGFLKKHDQHLKPWEISKLSEISACIHADPYLRTGDRFWKAILKVVRDFAIDPTA